MIQYDKLYQSLKKVSAEWHAGHVEWGYSWFYLKFYEDGIVIKTYLNGEDENEINAWFNPSAEGVIKGKYLIDNDRIFIKYDDGTTIEGALVNEGTILLQGKLNWEAFTLMNHFT